MSSRAVMAAASWRSYGVTRAWCSLAGLRDAGDVGGGEVVEDAEFEFGGDGGEGVFGWGGGHGGEC